MAIKRIVGKRNSKYRKCLGCDKHIDATLKDNKIYICEHCGQQHFIDVYENCIVLTVVERPDVRRRPRGQITAEQKIAREELLERAESHRRDWEAWARRQRAWLEELAEMTQEQLEIEYKFMGEEMKARVKWYFEKRKNM